MIIGRLYWDGYQPDNDNFVVGNDTDEWRSAKECIESLRNTINIDYKNITDKDLIITIYSMSLETYFTDGLYLDYKTPNKTQEQSLLRLCLYHANILGKANNLSSGSVGDVSETYNPRFLDNSSSEYLRQYQSLNIVSFTNGSYNDKEAVDELSRPEYQ